MSRCGAAFGAHQDVSDLRMSSFVREASARSLSFRCQGVVLRVARIKRSPACACRASCAKQAPDHSFEGSLHRGTAQAAPMGFDNRAVSLALDIMAPRGTCSFDYEQFSVQVRNTVLHSVTDLDKSLREFDDNAGLDSMMMHSLIC